MYIYTLFPPSYHHNGFVATHATTHHVPKSMSCHKAKGTEVITRRAQCLCEYVESGNLIIYYIFILYISNRNEALDR